jgi:outer membrane biosynthesis protein TonB
MYEVTGWDMADIASVVDQALLDAAEWAGVSVWAVIGGITAAIVILIVLAAWLVKRRRGASVKIYTEDGQLEFVEKTVAEFPADRIRIEGKKGKVVIKLISPKPEGGGEPLLPQEVKEEPLLSKYMEPKPPVPPEKEEKEPEPKSEPIAMGAVESAPEKPKKKPEESK